MGLELLKPDGRIASGPQCIYHLPGGIIFFSEAVREDGDSYIFDPEKTLRLILMPGKTQAEIQVTHFKGFQTLPFMPSTCRVGKAAVIITDCTDPKILELWRGTILGLVLAGTDYQMPPRGK